jgi:hypothetical protein
VSEIVDGFTAILSGNAFANAFWVFVGVVAGALVQYFLGWLMLRSQRKNAMKALETEISLNLKQIEVFRERINYLRERISASQITDDDLFVSMQGFDYSIVNPLVQAGYFHVMLGHTKVEHYFEFMRFFNNQNAQLVNSMLRTEHKKAKSLNYLILLSERTDSLVSGLRGVQLVASGGRSVRINRAA